MPSLNPKCRNRPSLQLEQDLDGREEEGTQLPSSQLILMFGAATAYKSTEQSLVLVHSLELHLMHRDETPFYQPPLKKRKGSQQERNLIKGEG